MVSSDPVDAALRRSVGQKSADAGERTAASQIRNRHRSDDFGPILGLGTRLALGVASRTRGV
jgi:hypothetical protein